LVHSPLFIFDENLERQPELAESFSVNDDGTQITFNLADANFHNGDPVTSEHVKFTYEFIQEKEVPLSSDIPFESIETPDDSTVVVNLTSPFPLFLTTWAPFWGILHKPTWEGVGTLSEFEPDNVVGSGPFELTSITQGQSITLEPSSQQHPRHNPDHGLVLFVFSDNQTKTRALRENEIQAASRISGADMARLSDQMSDDVLFQNVSKGIGAWKFIGANSRDPIFRDEFMDAVGMTINREEVNTIAFNGLADPVLHSGMYLLRAPYSPPEEDLHFYTDDPTGDPEGARQVLRDAGYGWDDDDNLRYPASYDVGPLWPKGETPSPDDYPCLNEDGEIVLDS
jgi:peptide/nickel transport system substrate-binding protein